MRVVRRAGSAGVRAGAADRARAGPRVAEAARLLIGLCEQCERLRGAGWCAGELRPRELLPGPADVRRAPPAGRIARRLAEARATRHLRAGHDLGCELLGLPLGAVDRLLLAWAGAEGAALLRDAVDEAIEELGAGAWHEGGSAAAVAYAVGRRITASLRPKRRKPRRP